MNQSNILRSALVIVAIVVFLGAAHPLAAQTVGTVRGIVTNAATHQPLSGAQISVVGGTRRIVTNGSGEYTMGDIPRGSVTLQAVILHYKKATRAITVAAGHAVIADFALVETSIPFTSIDTVPSIPRDR